MSGRRVYLGVGSNIEPAYHVRQAVTALRSAFGSLVLSPVYRNPPVGFCGEPFFNLVVGLRTRLDLPDLAGRLRELEAAHGRRRDGPRFSSRTLDIDILTYGDRVQSQGRLTVPRDEILQYAFVLRPLADIAGAERHPQTGERYDVLWARFRATWGEPELERVFLALEGVAHHD